MDNRVSMIALGVADLPRAEAFYQALGWSRSSQSKAGVIAFFQLAGGVVLCLFPRALLAEDACLVDAGPGFGGVTLAQNQRSRAEVDAVLQQAGAAGAVITKPAQMVSWGGYSGYFTDPDGHAWEVAWNPFFTLGAQGELQLPDSGSAA